MAIGEILPAEIVHELREHLEAAVKKQGETWVHLEARCRDKRVQHADVAVKRRIAPGR